MTSPKSTIICVGAVFIDTIWTVPHFPKEDTKLRAEKVIRRRGGNVANTLEVLHDIIAHTPPHDEDSHHSTGKLHLIASLPCEESADTAFIRNSIHRVNLAGPFRPSHQHAATSMIIQSKQDNTRTIVSHDSGLPELTCAEFLDRFRSSLNSPDTTEKVFVHFEGRNPRFILECIQQLRAMENCDDYVISIECEHPERKGLDDAAQLADVVFYSKLWAEKLYSATGPRQFLEGQTTRLKYMRPSVLLVCTWGAQGAVAVRLSSGLPIEPIVEAKVEYTPPGMPMAEIVDTVGAGDTFIAGMLYCLTHRSETTLEQKLQYAVEIASRKVYQDGFQGLGKAMKGAL